MTKRGTADARSAAEGVFLSGPFREKARRRSPQEQKIIDDAKAILMERNNMSEPEAFRYIQKCSMDSGNTMVESAQMVISIYDGG